MSTFFTLLLSMFLFLGAKYQPLIFALSVKILRSNPNLMEVKYGCLQTWWSGKRRITRILKVIHCNNMNLISQINPDYLTMFGNFSLNMIFLQSPRSMANWNYNVWNMPAGQRMKDKESGQWVMKRASYAPLPFPRKQNAGTTWQRKNILNAKKILANFDCDKCQTRVSGSGCCQSELVRVIESGCTVPCSIVNM